MKSSMKKILAAAGIAAVGAVLALAMVGCSSTGTSANTAESTANETHTVTLHRGLAAAHGESCFTQIVVATAEDGTILAVNVDDYQFMDATTSGLTAVPNSDKGFGTSGYASGKTLMSKTVNTKIYSELMKTKAGATTDWLVSMQAIEKYAVGKKASDLTNVTLDAVSGATLEDTPSYLSAIATVAKDNSITTTGTYTGDGSDLAIAGSQQAAHGEKCFTSVVTLTQGDTLVAASVDDYQFLASTTENLVPVPNSDKKFGTGYADGVKLASKSQNHVVYSANMAAKAGSTVDWLTSMEKIEGAVAGMQISEITTTITGPDAVSGATLEDTANYAAAIATTAKSAK